MLFLQLLDGALNLLLASLRLQFGNRLLDLVVCTAPQSTASFILIEVWQLQYQGSGYRSGLPDTKICRYHDQLQ